MESIRKCLFFSMRFMRIAILTVVVIVALATFFVNRDTPLSQPDGSYTRIVQRLELPSTGYAVFLIFQEGRLDVGGYGVFYNQASAKDLSASDFELVASIDRLNGDPIMRISDDCVVIAADTTAEFKRYENSVYAKIFGGAKNVASGEAWNEQLGESPVCFKRE